MTSRFFAVGALATALGFTALASPTGAQPIASHDPKAVKAGSYKVEPYHTQIGFSLSRLGISNYAGYFSGATGGLTIDPGNLSVTKLNVSLPVSSVLSTVPALDSKLKGDQWFDAERFPNATFVSTKVTKTGSNTATIVGDLTLHGATKPVTLKARLVGSGNDPLLKAFLVGFEATGDIKRSEFGIKQYIPMVGDDVTLTITGAFTLQP